MSQAHLFRLGMDLETGATHEEDTGHHRGHLTVVSDRDVLDRVLDTGRDDHFIRRDGKVWVRELLRGDGLVQGAG